MRRLLLLLLTFLLPLQLLAATVVDLAQRAVPVEQGVVAAPANGHRTCALPPAGMASPQSLAAAVTAKAAQSAQSIQAIPSPAPDVVLSDMAGEEGDEPDAPAPQADLEDHGIPASIATPDIAWHPFPHVFTVPLNGVSFLRDQLRPPPLV